MTRDADIRGMFLFNINAAEKRAIHAALRAGLDNGTLKPIINLELPLAEAARAHQLVLEPGAAGKIILVP